jgi:MFS family permease
VKDTEFKVKGFIVCGIAALFFLYEFLLRTVIGTFQHPIVQDLSLTSFQFSLLSTTVFLFVYGLMQLPVGIVVGNIGLKKSLIIGASACTVATFGFSYSYAMYSAVFFRFLMGFGASFGLLCLLIAINDWVPKRYNAIAIGISLFFGTLGPMVAAGPLDSLADSTGVSWRFVFLYLSLIGLVLVALIIFFVESNTEKAGKLIVLHRSEGSLASIKKLFVKIRPWYIAVLSATLYFAVEYISENEGRTFLALKNIPYSTASFMITSAWIGYAIGCPLQGFISDFFKRRKMPLVISSILGLFSIIGVLCFTDKNFLFISFFFLGIGASAQTIGFAIMGEQFKKEYVAIGFALNNAMINTVSAINAPVLGLFIDNIKKGVNPALNEYLFVFNTLIIISIISVILAVFFIKETYCKSTSDFTYLSPNK